MRDQYPNKQKAERAKSDGPSSQHLSPMHWYGTLFTGMGPGET